MTRLSIELCLAYILPFRAWQPWLGVQAMPASRLPPCGIAHRGLAAAAGLTSRYAYPALCTMARLAPVRPALSGANA